MSIHTAGRHCLPTRHGSGQAVVLSPATQNVSDEKQEDSLQILLHMLKRLVLRTLCETSTSSSLVSLAFAYSASGASVCLPELPSAMALIQMRRLGQATAWDLQFFVPEQGSGGGWIQEQRHHARACLGLCLFPPRCPCQAPSCPPRKAWGAGGKLRSQGLC